MAMSTSNGHIRFYCTQCSQPIRLRGEFAGKRCRCTNCRHEMTVPQVSDASAGPAEAAGSPDESDLGGSSVSKRYLGRKRSFKRIPRCPGCGTRLVLLGTMKSDPMLRCGRCGAEFMNQFFDADGNDESAGPETSGISDELRESWKGIFGGGGGGTGGGAGTGGGSGGGGSPADRSH